MSAEFKQGKIKWFDEKKGIGFIESEGSDELVFLHFSAVPTGKIKELKAGTKIRFTSDLDGDVKRAREVETF